MSLALSFILEYFWTDVKSFTSFIEKFATESQQKEFNHALGEIPPDKIYIIPVRLDDCEIPYEKLHDLWADLFPRIKTGLNFMRVL